MLEETMTVDTPDRWRRPDAVDEQKAWTEEVETAMSPCRIWRPEFALFHASLVVAWNE
jgi:hypothetical protein